MEGDLVKQLLQDLLIFGSAFAPLIYDVSINMGCEALIGRCKHLWKFVDENPKLRAIAVSYTMNIKKNLFTTTSFRNLAIVNLVN